MKHRGVQGLTGILLSAVLILGSLAGCSKKESSGNVDGTADDMDGGRAMGRYIEEEVILPVRFSDIYDMKKMEDGSIRLAGCSEERKSMWESKDSGNSWEKVYDFPEEIQDHVRYAVVSPDGRTACAYDGDEKMREEFCLLEQDGTLASIPFSLPHAEGTDMNVVMEIQFVGNDQLLIGDQNSTFYLVNVVDGSVANTFEFGNTQKFYFPFVAGKMLLFQSDSEILLYDSETGEKRDPGEAICNSLAESGGVYLVDTLDDGESIFYISEQGMYHYRFGGSVVEQLIDAGLNSLGNPSTYTTSLIMLDDQNLLVAENNTDIDGKSKAGLLRVTYSANTPTKPDKELKVFSLYETGEVRQAIDRFQKEHTEVYVHFEAALSRESGMNVSDALKTLTTEIMSGKGPDVLVLDGMPIETYIEKGILKDLSSIIDGNKEEYFEDIRNAYQNEQGEICAVPTRFLIPMIQSGSAYFAPGEDFDTFTGKKGALDNMQPRDVVSKFWYSSSPAWRKENKTLDQSKVADFFRKLKQVYGEPVVGEEENTENVQPNRLLNDDIILGEFRLLDGTWNTSVGLFGRNPDYALLLAVTERLESGNFACMPGQAEHVFVPSMTVGISSKSNQPKAAEQFVEYLFSREMQKISQGSGLPVDKEAFRSAIDGHWYEGNASQVTLEEIQFELVPRTEEEIQKIMELADSLTTPALQDEVIREVILEQGEKVMKDEQSPDEAAAAVIQKVNLYLAE